MKELCIQLLWLQFNFESLARQKSLMFKYKLAMDWESINMLSKVPRKKYIKKLLEYALAIAHNQRAVPPLATTPIIQQYPHDLGLSAQEAHKLINSLVNLLRWCQETNYDHQQMQQHLNSYIDQQVAAIIIDTLVKMRQAILNHQSSLVTQASKLLSFDWQLDMEVASDKGKTNTAIVELELITGRQGRADRSRVRLRGPEFDVFYKNLVKIKEELGQLVTQKE